MHEAPLDYSDPPEFVIHGIDASADLISILSTVPVLPRDQYLFDTWGDALVFILGMDPDEQFPHTDIASYDVVQLIGNDYCTILSVTPLDV